MARNLHKWKVCWGTFLPNSLFNSLFVTVFGMEHRQSNGIYLYIRQRTEKNADTRRSRSRNMNQGSQNSSGSKQPASHRAVTAIHRPLIKHSHHCGERNRLQTKNLRYYPTNRSSNAKRVRVNKA